MVNIQLIGLHCSIYGLRSSLLAFKTKWRKKGQKTKAQGSTLGICSMFSFRPVGAKAFHSQNLLPVPGAFSATLQPRALPWADVSMSLRDDKSRFCVMPKHKDIWDKRLSAFRLLRLGLEYQAPQHPCHEAAKLQLANLHDGFLSAYRSHGAEVLSPLRYESVTKCRAAVGKGVRLTTGRGAFPWV